MIGLAIILMIIGVILIVIGTIMCFMVIDDGVDDVWFVSIAPAILGLCLLWGGCTELFRYAFNQGAIKHSLGMVRVEKIDKGTYLEWKVLGVKDDNKN